MTFVLVQVNAQPTCISSLISLINQEDHILTVYSKYVPDYFSRHLKHSVIINVKENLNGFPKKLWKFQFYLIIINEIEDLKIFLQNFHRTPAWNPHGRFLVVTLSDLSNEEIFKLAWKYLVANLSVMDDNLDFHTYFPYGNNECGSSKVRKKISSCQHFNGFKTIFPSKALLNYRGCPMRMIVLIIPPYTIDVNSKKNPGFEIIILREIASYYNFSISYIPHKHRSWGHKLPNGTLTMMYGMMVSDEAEIMIGLMSTNTTFNNDIDTVDGHLDEKVTFYVPAALPLEPWRNFTMVFSNLIWSLILVSIVLVSSVCWLGGKTGNRDDEYKTFVDWIFRTLCILLASFNAHPKSNFLRLLFLLWSIYCLLVYSTYQGSLISFLTTPAYEHQLETVEELVGSGLSYGGTEIINPAFYEPNNPIFMKIYNNYVLCPVTEDCINRTAYKRDFAVVRNYRQIVYLTPKYYTLPNGRKMLYGFKKIIARYVLRISFVKGYPLFKGIEMMMLRMRDSGLLYKWDEDQQGARREGVVSNDVVVVLTVEHLKVAFVVLVVGNGSAFIIFIAELISTRLDKFKWL